MATLSQTTTALTHIADNPEVVSFAYMDLLSHFALTMDRRTWEEFGSPEEITINVTPGDNITPKDDDINAR